MEAPTSTAADASTVEQIVDDYESILRLGLSDDALPLSQLLERAVNGKR